MTVPRLLVPEVVQTSAMDCGPAALACLLGGFGIRASYARLRDACQTDVDGTSIDAIQDAAILLGLDAQQVMLPVEHLLLEESEALPAVVVTRQPGGLTHFVVVWRRHGRWLQVMDPAVGRRWVSARRFLDDVYVHEFAIPAAAFQAWARSDALRLPLLHGLARLGVTAEAARALVAEAADAPGWEALAALDAAVRAVTEDVRTRRLRRGQAAARVALLAARGAEGGGALDAEGPALIDEEHWFARPAREPGSVTIRGAVLVRVPARTGKPPALERLPADLRAALTQTDPSPAAFLRERLRGIGAGRPAAVVVGAVLAAAGVLGEAALLRALLSPGGDRRPLVAGLLALAMLLLVLEGALIAQALAVGHRLETGLRRDLLRRLPRLPDRYLSSRPLSDLAERAHRLRRLRELPALTADAVRLTTQLVLLPVVIGLIDPASALPAVLAAGVSTAAGFLLIPVQAERDVRLRSHVGTVARFYLDALVGLVAIRSHSAEPVIKGEHDLLLGAWASAVRGVHRTAITAEFIQGVLGLALVAWLLGSASGRVTDPATFLLLAYWAAGLPAVGQQLGVIARRYPAHRSATLRIIEPFATPADKVDAGTAHAAETPDGVAVHLAGVQVAAGGQPILAVDDLVIPAGAQVAVVGRSGSGKSSLAGLLLGRHTPAQGQVFLDGAPLDPARLARLRRRTAWVDPTVTLWNRRGRRSALRPGATLLFITHDIADTLEFDRVLVIEGGRIVEDGIPAILAAKPESPYKALLDAEEATSRIFDEPEWKHLRVADGTVSETAPVGGLR